VAVLNPVKPKVTTPAPAPKTNYNPSTIIANQKMNSSEQMARYNRLLEQQAKAQISGAEAGYASSRDQQISELQKSLNQSVLDGQLSVKQAETQFENQKKSIQQQAYNDTEVTGTTAQTMGIQNSQQMLGMMASDQARNQSLNNDNMSARDMKIYEIDNRLNAIRSAVGIDMASANAGYNNNVTMARSQVEANMYGQQFDMQLGEYNRIANLEGQFDQMGLQQQYTQSNMAIEQGYNKDNMATQQGYTVKNMATEQGYNKENMAIQQKYALDNMSVQQKYTLQQFAVQHNYDLKKMSVGQVYELAQMAKQNGYNVGLQNDQQSFQGGQASLDRSHQATQNNLARGHDKTMANVSHNNALKQEDALYQRQLTREYNAYNTPGSTEFKTRTAQEKAGISSALIQQGMNMVSDAKANHVSSLMESLPKLSGSPKQSEINAYNSRVKTVNSQMKSLVGADAFEYFKIPTYQSSGTSTGTSTGTKATTKYETYLNKNSNPASATSSKKYSPHGF
jgi:hypothetical protein